ncbi:MAG TPA: peptide deformylase, partial [Candidatus Limnocylindrales bacterium]|nr:peptide deformylase [Candidatus Limnocylindrales bacterium]
MAAFHEECALILPIVQVGEPVLRQQARPLRPNEIRSREIRELIADMKETMYGAPGVGLAAPQIGRNLQLAVIEDRSEYTKDWTPEQLAERERTAIPFHVIINPRLTLIGDEKVEFFEGCLSLNGLLGLVPRARSVRVECLDEMGGPRVIEAAGWYARILQHEIDHLGGTVYVDRMYPRTLMTVENYKQHWLEKSLEQIKEEIAVERR